MKLLDGKDAFVKYSFTSLLITIIAFVLTVPFFFLNMMGIPLGILTGGIFHSIFFYLFSISERKMKLTIGLQVTRTILMAGITLLFAYLYKNGFEVFNPFAFLGAYVVILIIYMIMARKERNDG